MERGDKKVSELNPCPFCKERMDEREPTVFDMKDGCWVVSHFCKTIRRGDGGIGVAIHVYGNSKEEAINNWNAGAAEGGKDDVQSDP